MKKIRAVLLFIALAAGILLPFDRVYATVLPDESMEITPEMEMQGVTGFAEENGEENGNTKVMISDSIVYDQMLQSYCYPVGQSYVYSNVIDGMMTQAEVSVTADEGVVYRLYQDSEPLAESATGYSVTEPGSYTVMTGNDKTASPLFSFRIIGASIREPNRYSMPAGCVVLSVTRDGEELSADSREVVLMEEGHYALSYVCIRSDQYYFMEYTVDHTPPELTFEGVADGKARGEVTIQGLETGDILHIYRGDTEISARTTLSQPGEYKVKVEDAAGNSNVYTFFIMFYLNTGGISFGLVLLLAIIALCIYLAVMRKKLRVR